MKSDIISLLFFNLLALLPVMTLVVSDRLSLYYDKMAAAVSAYILSSSSPYKKKELCFINYL